MKAPTLSLTNDHLHEKLCCETRRLVYYAQHQFKQGQLSLFFRKGDFLYSYRFWVEGYTGEEEVIQTGAITANDRLTKTPWGPRYYQRLIRELFPTRETSEMKCYELYTLHLGIVRADIVAKNLHHLIAKFVEHKVYSEDQEQLLVFIQST
jgi:hypothetical protein